jgi:hypothetical protein
MRVLFVFFIVLFTFATAFELEGGEALKGTVSKVFVEGHLDRDNYIYTVVIEGKTADSNYKFDIPNIHIWELKPALKSFVESNPGLETNFIFEGGTEPESTPDELCRYKKYGILTIKKLSPFSNLNEDGSKSITGITESTYYIFN